MSLGQKVKELRQRLNWSQGQLAIYVGVDRAYISQIEHDLVQSPSARVLVKIAQALRVDPAMLFEEAGYIPKGGQGHGPLRPRTPQEILRELEAATPILVPEVGVASAGPGSPGDQFWSYQPAPEERRHDFVAVEVTGTCMEPRIPKGARVIVDKNASPKPGDIVVAILDGEVLVKQLAAQDGKLVLVAVQGQEPIDVNEGVHIIGVVKQWGMRP